MRSSEMNLPLDYSDAKMILIIGEREDETKFIGLKQEVTNLVSEAYEVSLVDRCLVDEDESEDDEDDDERQQHGPGEALRLDGYTGPDYYSFRSDVGLEIAVGRLHGSESLRAAVFDTWQQMHERRLGDVEVFLICVLLRLEHRGPLMMGTGATYADGLRGGYRVDELGAESGADAQLDRIVVVGEI